MDYGPELINKLSLTGKGRKDIVEIDFLAIFPSKRTGIFVLRSVKGLKDILPQQAMQWQHLEAVARTMATHYGFSEIRIPIFEFTELYARSIGGTTDIVEKEMYTFPDRDGEFIDPTSRRDCWSGQSGPRT